MLVVDPGGRLLLLGISPKFDTAEELDWMAHEIRSFIADVEQRDPSAVGATPRRRAALLAHGLDLACASCGAAVTPSAEAMVKRVATCPQCQGQVVLPKGLRRKLTSVDESFEHRSARVGSRITVALSEDRLAVRIPRGGWSESSFSHAFFFFSLVLGSAMFAVGFATAAQSWSDFFFYVLAVAAAIVAVVFALALWGGLRKVYEDVTVVIDASQTKVERRFLGRTSVEAMPTGSLTGATFVSYTTEDDTSDFHTLRLEIAGQEPVSLTSAEWGDEWTWIAQEVNAFLATLRSASRVSAEA